VRPVNNTRAPGLPTSRPGRAKWGVNPRPPGATPKAECSVGNRGRLSRFIVPQIKPAKESRPSRGVGKGAVG
jgi:hypothetical protein